MKLVTEYLQQAAEFERMAAEATDPKLKIALEKQAASYHRLAAKRAAEFGIPLPQRPPIRTED